MSLSSIPSPKGGRIIGSIVFLGDISYALYLTHTLAFVFLAYVAAAFGVKPIDHVWPYAGAMLVTALLIAVATHLLFEKPVTKSLQKWIDGRPLLPVKSVLRSQYGSGNRSQPAQARAPAHRAE
jgi:peptidoglycan/LPS O-acetylase OafA/YrhL